jgi:cytidyltransferase-like protein
MKIIEYKKLEKIRRDNHSKKIVLCHGTFDIVHPGHLFHFEEARSQGDLLVVTITGDEYVNKKNKLFFNEKLRSKQLAALDMVDYVAVIQEPSALTSIKFLKPDVYVKGNEYSDLLSDPSANIIKEKEMVESFGGTIYFTNGQEYSSTKIGYFTGTMTEASERGLSIDLNYPKFKDLSEYGFNLVDLKKHLTEIRKLKVCLIGETIIDEWCFVKLHSISHKSKCISGEEKKRKQQIGGSGIIARHLANFVNHVDFFTNHKDCHNDYAKNVRLRPLSSGLIKKTRFINDDNQNVIYENKVIEQSGVNKDKLPADLSEYDIVMISDFGHGLIDRALACEIVQQCKSFLAVQVQSNSSNYGFNLLKKYPYADYYSMNRLEAELQIQNKSSTRNELINKIMTTIHSKYFAVTFGEHGASLRGGTKTFNLPAITSYIKDPIGCGDAFFAFSALALKTGANPSVALLSGNIGAAIMAHKFCNEAPVSFQEFLTLGKIVI